MRFSTLILCCGMILCCTGLLDRAAARLCVRTGTIAALCPLLAAAGKFSADVFPWLRIGLGAVLLLGVCLLLCRDGFLCVTAWLFAACAGAVGFVLVRSFSWFYEPGLLIALPAAMIAAALLGDRRAALLCTASAPLFYAFCVLLEGYYLFRTVLLDLAAWEIFDAGTGGAMLLLLFLQCKRPKEKRVCRGSPVFSRRET